MLMFETSALVILGILAGAELINALMLGLVSSSVSPVLAPAGKRRTSSNQIM